MWMWPRRTRSAAERFDVQHDFPQIEQLLGTIYAERHRYADAAEKFSAHTSCSPPTL